MEIDLTNLEFDHSMDDDWPEGKVGYCAIVGRPNVGKSTFINQVLQYHLTAVSSKPNTTRKRWLGIYSSEKTQIIFTDTPGIHAEVTKMHEAMMKGVRQSIQKNDVILCLCDASREFGDEDQLVCDTIKESKKPVILAVNKVDSVTMTEARAMKMKYLKQLGRRTPVIEVSALHGNRTDDLIGMITERLPEGPFLYPADQMTDAFVRDIAEEVIRETFNEEVQKELPHSIAVQIERWRETDKKVKIDACVYVARDSQKGILIGEGGRLVNRVIKVAREKIHKDLEQFIDLKIYVKVNKDWQNKKSFLKELGIIDADK